MTTRLRVQGLTVTRGGRTVVRGVDLEVARGEVLSLLGPNGAGRSSTILAIAGVLPSTGTIRVGETTLTGLRPDQMRRAGVSTVLENHRVLTDLTVSDNLKVAGGKRGAERRARIERVLATFPELEAHLDRPAGQLSGGQQQMLALGQALANEPQFLLIDEMSMGLAPVVVSRLLAVLRSLAERGIGILLVEQFAHLALGISDRAAVMARGQLVYSGEAAELRDDAELLHHLYMGVGLDDQPELGDEPEVAPPAINAD
jgi:branched-chain amino acid transport system ATP-binding protein